MTAPLLTIRDARLRRGGREVLHGVDLDLAEGRVTALLGPSGSGKTSLLRAIAGLERLESGAIAGVSGPLDAKGHWVRPKARGFGLVFQDGALFPHMTAVKNVMFGLHGHERGKRREEAMTWLDRVGLADRAGAYPHELSGGEQQRIALARALAPHPRLILLDEPFSSLDRTLRTDLRRRTAQILAASGTTALLVTHDAEEAMEMAAKIALMQDGRILQTGPADELYAHPVSCAAAQMLGAANTWTGTVRTGALDTPVGCYPADGFSEGETASLIVRPERLRIEAGGSFTIVRRTFRGSVADLTAIASDGSEWTASLPAGRLPQNERAGLSAGSSDVVIVRG